MPYNTVQLEFRIHVKKRNSYALPASKRNDDLFCSMWNKLFRAGIVGEIEKVLFLEQLDTN